MTTKAATTKTTAAKTTADAIIAGETTFTDVALAILEPAKARRTKATATSAPAKPAPVKATAKPAAKAKAEKPVVDRSKCAGGVNVDDVETRIDCTEPVASPSNRLCKAHSTAYKAGTFRMSKGGVKAVRELIAAGVEVAYGKRPTTTPKAPKAPSAATAKKVAKEPTKVAKVAKNSGGTKRASTPPVRAMGSGAVARSMPMAATAAPAAIAK